jgi:hypothetical protein
MGLADRPRQGVLGWRPGNQVNMIRHQAVRPNLDTALLAPLRHELDIGRVVVLAEERLLPTIPPLRHMM